MIPKPMKVAAFIYIDRCGEGVGWSHPADGEEYIGIPHGWYDVGAPGCIEVHKGGKLRYTINLADVSCIEFAEDQK